MSELASETLSRATRARLDAARDGRRERPAGAWPDEQRGEPMITGPMARERAAGVWTDEQRSEERTSSAGGKTPGKGPRTSERSEPISPLGYRLPMQRTAGADPVPTIAPPPLRRARSMAPPTRRRVATAPRVVARAACVDSGPRLPVRWLLAIAGVACLAVVGLGVLSGSGASSVPERTTVVRVQSGESLWELAGRVAPGSDPSAVVDRIRELNGGLTEGVRPGQPLSVPTAG